MRKLILTLLVAAICLVGVTPVLAQETEIYQLEEYEQLIGKKMVFSEAPMLRTMVAAGELPPLEERLPVDPLVIKPAEEIGQYGGTMRQINEGLNESNFSCNYGFQFLVNYSPDMSRLYPNVLKGWEASEDAKKFTLYLRKGMRWSDGVPFTADDILFYFEDVALNKDLYPTTPSRFVIGGEPGMIRKIDEYTVEVSFKESFGLFIENLARWRPDCYLPKHYLKQFHPKYTPMDEIEGEMKKEGYDTWANLFMAKVGDYGWFWGIPERPVLGPFVAQNEVTESVHILTRNPYFFQVDTEGNQLPYIDKIERYLVKDMEAQILKVIAGEIDFMTSILWGLKNHPLIMENQEEGNYRVMAHWWPSENMGTVKFNMSHEDPVLKKLFNDKRFRVALSVAMDRDEINQLIFKGLATPSQPTVASGPPFYGEKIGRNYLEYDPTLANQLLDEIGLSERDKEGYRLRSDGKRLRMMNTVPSLWSEDMDIAELYKGYWKAIGIEMVNKSISFALFGAILESGKYDIVTYASNLGGRPMNPLTRGAVFPLTTDFGVAPKWGLWFVSEGEKGEEPPEDLKRIMKIREEALSEPSEEKRIALTIEALKIFDENLWLVGGLNTPSVGQYWVTQNRLRNVAASTCYNLMYDVPAQFFIKE